VDATERTLIEGEEDSSALCDSSHQEAELLVLLECDRPLALSSRHFLSKLDTVAAGRGATRSFIGDAAPHRSARLGVPDRWMSTQHARFTRQGGSWWVADADSTNGTRVNGQRIEQQQLSSVDKRTAKSSSSVMRQRSRNSPKSDFSWVPKPRRLP
jgi:hypothetical protein